MPGPTTALNIVTNAFLEAGIFEAGETLSNEDSSFGFSKLNRMLDAWDADRLSIYATDFLQFVLIPGIQPLLIGQAVNVTAVSSDGTNATYTGRNTYQQGDIVSTGKIGTIGGLNFDLLDQVVQSATPTQFVLANAGATVGTTTVTGMAIYSTVDDEFPSYATATQRPVKIADANIILTNTSPPFTKTPLRIRDKDWWIANTVPTVTTTLPTDLYYDPIWPNGRIYLWPLQSTNYGLELEVYNNLAGYTDLTQQFWLPPGYEDAVTYNLAVALCPSNGRPLDSTLEALAIKSKGKIQDLNSKSPKITTRDPGIPRGSHNRSYFNYLSGQVVPPR